MSVQPIMAEGPNGDLSARGLTFWPYERVEEVFKRMEAAAGTPREAAELLIFWRRMKRLYDEYSVESDYFLEKEEALRMAALGEAVEDAEFVASITESKP